MNEKALLLDSYQKLAEFLAGSLGSMHHTIVYDIDEETEEGTVFAVYGDMTGRKKGDPLTPFVRVMVRNFKESGDAGITHVDTEASTAEGRVRLSVFAIRDSRERLAGIFMIAMQVDLMYTVRDALNQYLGYDPARQETRLKAPGTFNEGSGMRFSNYMQQRIREEIEAYGIPVDRMTNEERIQIIHRLEQMEVFFMKDSVKTTAELLGISVPTVYRLMKLPG